MASSTTVVNSVAPISDPPLLDDITTYPTDDQSNTGPDPGTDDSFSDMLGTANAGIDPNNVNTDQTKGKVSRMWSRWFTLLSTWIGAQGASKQVPYDATMFDNSTGGGWTPSALEIENFTYRIVGNTFFLNLTIIGTTPTTSLSTYVTVSFPTIPFGKYVPVEAQYFACLVGDNSANWILGRATVNPGFFPSAKIVVQRADNVAWVAGHTISLAISVSFQINLVNN